MKWIWVGSAVLLLVFLAATKLFGRPDAEVRQMASERAMIDRCRAEQNDPLQELATRRLMRQGCDKMEADYRAKWSVGP